MKNTREKTNNIAWNTKENKQLIGAILSLQNTNEARCFLRDLMTEKEIKEFSNRLEVASLLSKDVQYCAIIKSTGLSSTTIARISKWLKGSLGGYRLILNRLNKTGSTLLATSHHNSSKIGKGLYLNL